MEVSELMLMSIAFVAIIPLLLSTILVTGKVMAQVGNMTAIFIPTKDPVQQKWRCQEWQAMTEHTKNSSIMVNSTTVMVFGMNWKMSVWNEYIGLYNKRCAGITEFIHPDLNVKENN